MAGPEKSSADVHPNDDLLLALHNGVLFSGDRPLVEGHLKTCPRCRARLTALTEDISPAAPSAKSEAGPDRTGLTRRLIAAVVLLGILAAAGIVAWRELDRRDSEPVALATTPAVPDRLPTPSAIDAPDPPAVGPASPEAEPVTPALPVTEPEPAPAQPTAVDALVITSPNRNFRWRVVGLEVQRTNDGGQQWRKQSVELTKAITAGTAPSAAVCWLVGRGGAVFMAVGAQWKDVSLTETVDLVQVAAIDSMNATVTAADGRQFSTSDAGASWTLLQ